MNIESLIAKVKKFPTSPGVYLMKDAQGETIYIGKAKSLRSRVKDYFAGTDTRSQIEFLLKRIDDIETIVTETERQALVLERDLVNKIKPRYNIRLKDDKTFLSVKIDKNKEWPRLELVRKIEDDGALYFGPFAFNHELRTLLEVIKRVVPLRTCSDTVFYNRQRPCLEYQIKRCAGPCCLPVDRNHYLDWLDQATKILQGKNSALINQLNKQMQFAAEDLRFEEAAILRDRISILEKHSSVTEIISHRGENRDVYGFKREGSLFSMAILQVRNGKIASSKNFDFSDVLVENAAVLESVILQYYEQAEVPDELVLPIDLENNQTIAEYLSEKHGSKVEILLAKIGLKARLLDIAKLNAEQQFTTKFDADRRASEISKELAKRFKLSQLPRRIECVDISNLQGTDIVVGLVSFFDTVADKSSYKKYILEHKGKPDDFACIHEVVYRRLKRGREENNLPDLLIIDGGAGQLGAALNARDELEIKIDIIALAKLRLKKDSSSGQFSHKPERIFLAGAEEAIPLENDDLGLFLQRVRDEVHRYAITFHRQRRAKRVFKSELDSISGLGPERRGRLLRHFGSVKKIKQATPEQIAKVGRMPLTLANRLINRLRDGIQNN